MTKIAKALTHARWFRVTILAVILLAGVLAGLETSAALTELPVDFERNVISMRVWRLLCSK